MGALWSSIVEIDQDYCSDNGESPHESGVVGNEYDSTSTTPAVFRHKRLIDLDPRSPSEGVLRTPIIVDKTPSTKASTTPSLVDPRSPTADFSRTPILPGSSSVKRNVSPARGGLQLQAPGSGVTYMSSESGIDSRDVSPEMASSDVCAASLCTASPDSVIDQEEMCSSDEDQISPRAVVSTPLGLPRGEDALGGDRLGTPIHDSIWSSDVKQQSGDAVIAFKKVEIEDTPKAQCVLKYRSQGPVDKRLGMLSVNSGKSTPVRSPLSFVDNSPRHIVSKQSVTNMRPAYSYDTSVDKENRL